MHFGWSQSHCPYERELLVFESVVIQYLISVIPISIYLHNCQKHKQGHLLNYSKDTYIGNTRKMMTTPRVGQRQGCKKCLNFIPGIVIAFQGGLGQNYFSRFLKRKDNRGGRGMTKQSQMNKFFLCSVRYIPVFWKLLRTHRPDLRKAFQNSPTSSILLQLEEQQQKSK